MGTHLYLLKQDSYFTDKCDMVMIKIIGGWHSKKNTKEINIVGQLHIRKNNHWKATTSYSEEQREILTSTSWIHNINREVVPANNYARTKCSSNIAPDIFIAKPEPSSKDIADFLSDVGHIMQERNVSLEKLCMKWYKAKHFTFLLLRDKQKIRSKKAIGTSLW